jgi:hypothetical protein
MDRSGGGPGFRAPGAAVGAAGKGRGAGFDPPNRFDAIRYEAEAAEDVGLEPEERPALETRFLRDPSRSIVATNDSPDLGFDASVNPYRGCEHGCVYCYARPTHEYLGLSAGLDFETRILVKEGAPALLRRTLASPRWTPRVVALSGVTDPYQPIERRLGVTRACLEVLLAFRNPVVTCWRRWQGSTAPRSPYRSPPWTRSSLAAWSRARRDLRCVSTRSDGSPAPGSRSA